MWLVLHLPVLPYGLGSLRSSGVYTSVAPVSKCYFTDICANRRPFGEKYVIIVVSVGALLETAV